MNFRELAEVVAHAGVMPKIDLGNHDDDADGGEDEHHLVEGKIARVVIIALKHKKMDFIHASTSTLQAFSI